MVSDSASSASVNAAGPMHQPLRNPGAAWDFEIEETTMARSARSGFDSGDENVDLSKTRSS